MHVKNNDILTHGQTIACLEEETYKTQTGGIVYYSTDLGSTKRNEVPNEFLPDPLYWIPEETHQLSSTDIESLKVKNGAYVSKDTELLPNLKTSLSGFVQIDTENSELVMKPGELYQTQNNLLNDGERESRFVNQGDTLFSDLVVQKLSYLEFINYHGVEYILLRPVQVFQVPQEKGFNLKYKFFTSFEKT